MSSKKSVLNQSNYRKKRIQEEGETGMLNVALRFFYNQMVVLTVGQRRT